MFVYLFVVVCFIDSYVSRFIKILFISRFHLNLVSELTWIYPVQQEALHILRVIALPHLSFVFLSLAGQHHQTNLCMVTWRCNITVLRVRQT